MSSSSEACLISGHEWHIANPEVVNTSRALWKCYHCTEEVRGAQVVEFNRERRLQLREVRAR